jgi:GH43 family beta-xylosidase
LSSADPYILRHDGNYYFVASVPEYDRLEIRRASTLRIAQRKA